jgi:carbon storage regulator
MLVLARKLNQRIIIDDHTVVTIVKIGKDFVRLGIEAPDQVKIFREEIYPSNSNDGGEASNGGEPSSA